MMMTQLRQRLWANPMP